MLLLMIVLWQLVSITGTNTFFVFWATGDGIGKASSFGACSASGGIGDLDLILDVKEQENNITAKLW
jgi:hypothetical protein